MSRSSREILPELEHVRVQITEVKKRKEEALKKYTADIEELERWASWRDEGEELQNLKNRIQEAKRNKNIMSQRFTPEFNKLESAEVWLAIEYERALARERAGTAEAAVERPRDAPEKQIGEFLIQTQKTLQEKQTQIRPMASLLRRLRQCA